MRIDAPNAQMVGKMCNMYCAVNTSLLVSTGPEGFAETMPLVPSESIERIERNQINSAGGQEEQVFLARYWTRILFRTLFHLKEGQNAINLCIQY